MIVYLYFGFFYGKVYFVLLSLPHSIRVDLAARRMFHMDIEKHSTTAAAAAAVFTVFGRITHSPSVLPCTRHKLVTHVQRYHPRYTRCICV